MSNTELRKLEKGADFEAKGGNFAGKSAEGIANLRGLQADLNRFGEVAHFDHVKVDGVVGSQTATAVRQVHAEAVMKNAGLMATPFPPPETAELVAEHAMYIRFWLDGVAAKELNVGRLRRYHFGAGKDWNVKDTIAYGAGDVHKDFVALQGDLNRYAKSVDFPALETDGFIGPKTAAAVKRIYDATIAKNPGLIATAFPVPDSKEEVAEYASFIREWIAGPVARTLGGGDGAAA